MVARKVSTLYVRSRWDSATLLLALGLALPGEGLALGAEPQWSAWQQSPPGGVTF